MVIFFPPLSWVFPSSMWGPQGIYIMLPWEILTADTSGRAVLQPQIQKHKQAGNTKLQFPPRRHIPHSTLYIMNYTFRSHPITLKLSSHTHRE